MNKVIQTVTLCADPAIKSYGNDGKVMATFSGAVNKQFHKDGEPTADFFQYKAFGKTAEIISKYFVKGSRMLIVDGEIQNNNYINSEGVKVYGQQILINKLEFMDKKSASSAQTPAANTAGNTSASASNDEFYPDSYSGYDDFE